MRIHHVGIGIRMLLFIDEKDKNFEFIFLIYLHNHPIILFKVYSEYVTL